MTRRQFLARTSAGLIVPAFADVRIPAARDPQSTARAARNASPPIRVGIVAPEGTTATSVRQGLRLGREEAERAASLLGARLEFPVGSDGDVDAVLEPDPATFAGQGDHGRAAVIAFGVHETTTTPTCWSVRADAAARLAAAVRIFSSHAKVRTWGLLADSSIPEPDRAAFREAVKAAAGLIASERQLDAPDPSAGSGAQPDAVAVIGRAALAGRPRAQLLATENGRAWLARIPLDADLDPATLQAREASVVEWHHDLTRFGGSELNERYSRTFGGDRGTRMNSDAWAGWFAMRLVADAALRARGREGDIGSAIATGRFDGHKGVALAFDGTTRRLRQPLYVVARTDNAPEPLLWEEPS